MKKLFLTVFVLGSMGVTQAADPRRHVRWKDERTVEMTVPAAQRMKRKIDFMQQAEEEAERAEEIALLKRRLKKLELMQQEAAKSNDPGETWIKVPRGWKTKKEINERRMRSRMETMRERKEQARQEELAALSPEEREKEELKRSYKKWQEEAAQRRESGDPITSSWDSSRVTSSYPE